MNQRSIDRVDHVFSLGVQAGSADRARNVGHEQSDSRQITYRRRAPLYAGEESVKTQSSSGYWVVVGAPASPVEQQVLDSMRELLPDGGITLAWAT